MGLRDPLYLAAQAAPPLILTPPSSLQALLTMRIAGIIVNYRTPELTIEATRSLLAEMRQIAPYRLYLVDNASGDQSIPLLEQAIAREQWQQEVELIKAPRNGGFGYGINQAVRRALALESPPEYFYVLNSDALVDPGSLRRMVEFLDGHPDGGLAGSHIHGPDGSSQVAAFRFPSVLSEIVTSTQFGPVTQLLGRWMVKRPTPAQDSQVDWVSGTSMLIRRATFERTGLFDEGFFLYFEEVDFCRSARKTGCNAYFVADAPITHLGSASTGFGDTSRPMPGYWFDSRHRYFRKHHGLAYAVACDVVHVAGHVFWRLKERAAGRSGKSRPRLLRDFIAASVRNFRGHASVR
jgi:N-acetylglucosaminyl-diphospho-decaprenol L-rhamnosyltransferase